MVLKIKTITIFIMSFFYVIVGIDHFERPEWYVRIVPPFFPEKYGLVLISGAVEIILGIMLLHPKLRYIACWGLIMLLIAVYPANIYLAWTNGAALNTTPLIAWGRLPIQFIFIGLAYWHKKA